MKISRRAARGALAVVVVLVAAGTGTAFAVGRSTKAASRARAGVTSVSVATATAGAASSALSLSGSVVATSSLSMSAGASGRVVAVNVVAGQTVGVGQLLVSVSDPVLSAQLSEAQAAVATAEAKLAAADAPPSGSTVAVAVDGVAKAQASLNAAEVAYQQAQQAATPSSPSGAGDASPTQGAQAQLAATRQALAVAQAGLALAQAQAAQAEAPASAIALQPLVAAVTQARAAASVIQAEIAQGSVTAPFAGTVVSLDVTVGQQVTVGTPLLSLDGTVMGVQAPVAQSDVSLLRDGETATVTVVGAPGSLPATVSAISPLASSSTLTFDVTLSPASVPAWMHPGEAASVSVITSSTQTAVLIPADAIVSINGVPQVFVVIPRALRAASPEASSNGTAAATAKNAGVKKVGAKKRNTPKAAPDGGAGESGTVSLVDVTPSVSDGSTTEVSGISAGELVVVAGQTYLAKGDQVRIASTVAVPTSVTGSSVGGLVAAPSTATPKNGTGGGRKIAVGEGAG